MLFSDSVGLATGKRFAVNICILKLMLLKMNRDVYIKRKFGVLFQTIFKIAAK